MEKRIKYSQFQQVKSAAKMIDPSVRKIEALKKKIVPIVEEMKSYQKQIDALEAGIVEVLGFHVSDLVKKVTEPTGTTDKNGKAVMVTKYLPTDIVTYDEHKKEYVITIPAPEAHQTEEVVTPEEHVEEPQSQAQAEETQETEQIPWEI